MDRKAEIAWWPDAGLQYSEALAEWRTANFGSEVVSFEQVYAAFLL